MSFRAARARRDKFVQTRALARPTHTLRGQGLGFHRPADRAECASNCPALALTRASDPLAGAVLPEPERPCNAPLRAAVTRAEPPRLVSSSAAVRRERHLFTVVVQLAGANYRESGLAQDSDDALDHFDFALHR